MISCEPRSKQRARISRETSFHGNVRFSNEHYLVRETCPNFLASCWLLEFSTQRRDEIFERLMIVCGKKRIWKRVFFRGFQQIDSSKENVVFVRCNYIVWRESVRNWKLNEIFESSWVKVSLFSAKISISTFDRGYFLGYRNPIFLKLQ